MALATQLSCNGSKRPTRPTVLVAIDEGVIGDDLSALEVKFKPHLASTHFDKGISHTLMVLLLTKKEKESTSSCTGDFPS
jgi:hypothetical protein